MPETNDAREQTLRTHAEPEMAAFLQAATDVVGQSGLEQAGGIWLQELESLDHRDESIAKFFRRVTINAISQLVADPRTRIGNEKGVQAREAGWRPILLTSHCGDRQERHETPQEMRLL